MTRLTDPNHTDPRSRRDFLVALGGLVGLAGIAGASTGLTAQPGRPSRAQSAIGLQPSSTSLTAAPRAITIYKDPNCGCCKLWVAHMQKAGFVATVHDTADMATVKSSMGVPDALQSCHTARIASYTIEGHVPADVIVKLLEERPEGRGLAVPGMPMGSPGMEGGRAERYAVLLFDKTGKSRVYASR